MMIEFMPGDNMQDPEGHFTPGSQINIETRFDTKGQLPLGLDGMIKMFSCKGVTIFMRDGIPADRKADLMGWVKEVKRYG